VIILFVFQIFPFFLFQTSNQTLIIPLSQALLLRYKAIAVILSFASSRFHEIIMKGVLEGEVCP
jgi:hypothetical protein